MKYLSLKKYVFSILALISYFICVYAIYYIRSNYSLLACLLFYVFSILISVTWYVGDGYFAYKNILFLNYFIIISYIISCYYIIYISVYYLNVISLGGFKTFHPWYEIYVGIPCFIINNAIVFLRLAKRKISQRDD